MEKLHLIMLGEHKDVSVFLKNKNPSMIMHGCACHLVHLAAQHALKKDFGYRRLACSYMSKKFLLTDS